MDKCDNYECNPSLKAAKVTLEDVEGTKVSDMLSFSPESGIYVPPMLDNNLGIKKPACDDKLHVNPPPATTNEQRRKDSPRRGGKDVENGITNDLNEPESITDALANMTMNIVEPLMAVGGDVTSVQKNPSSPVVDDTLGSLKSNISETGENVPKKIDKTGNGKDNKIAMTVNIIETVTTPACTQSNYLEELDIIVFKKIGKKKKLTL